MQDNVQDKAVDVLGYRFSDPSLLREALTHASSAGHRLQSNERMEFLGDAILGVIVCEYLYQSFPDLLEGELTKIKSAVVSRRVCATISRDIDLADMLNLGKGMCGGQQELPSSVAAAVLESVIAAIYLDGGMEPTRDFVLRHLRPVIQDAADSAHQQNFKSVLQHLSQKILPVTPNYVLMDEKGPDHAKAFEVCVDMGGRRYPARWANSKKQAEQSAALAALVALGAAEIADDGEIAVYEDLEELNYQPIDETSDGSPETDGAVDTGVSDSADDGQPSVSRG